MATTATLFVVTILVFATSTGCEILTALGGGEGLACDDDQACRSGLICVDLRCERPGTCTRDEDCAEVHDVCRNGACVAAPDAGTTDAARDASSNDSSGRDAWNPDRAAYDLTLYDQIPGDHPPAHDVAISDTAHSDAMALDIGGADLPAADLALSDRAAIDRGSVDAAQPAPSCGTVSICQDDFTVAMQPHWVQNETNGASLARTANGLVLTTPATVPSGSVAHAEVYTRYEVDLRGDTLTFDVVSATVPVVSGVVYLQLVHDSANSLRFVVGDGVLVAEVVRPSGSARQQIGATNLFAPGRWRIREQQGTISFETSVANRDGGAWQSHFTTATATHLARGLIQIELGASDLATISGNVTIRSVNLGQPATTWCRASSWRDDFNGILALRPEWATASTGNGACMVMLQNDQLGILNPIAPGDECGVATRSAYSLVDDSISIEMVSYPAEADLFSRLVVQWPGMLITYGKHGSNLVAEIYDQGTIVWSCFTALTGSENWLVISDQGGLLSFEYKAGARTPKYLFAATQTTLHLDEVTIGVTSLCESTCVGDQAVWFDNYND